VPQADICSGVRPFEDVLGHDLAEACTASLCL
jgi:hypothetical protein